MKIFIYGAQSSGASLFTFFLAQKPDTLAIVDLYAGEHVPPLDNIEAKDILVKATVNTDVLLEDYLSEFRPDRKILFLRNPYYNYASLKKKEGKNDGGNINDKFCLLEKVFTERNKFDLVVLYEDFVLDFAKVLKNLEKLKFGVKEEFLNFNRTYQDICSFNFRQDPWFKENYLGKWGLGNIHFLPKGLHILKIFKYISAKEKKKVKKLCPSFCAYYEKNFHWDTRKRVLYCANLIFQPPYFWLRRVAKMLLERKKHTE